MDEIQSKSCDLQRAGTMFRWSWEQQADRGRKTAQARMLPTSSIILGKPRGAATVNQCSASSGADLLPNLLAIRTTTSILQGFYQAQVNDAVPSLISVILPMLAGSFEVALSDVVPRALLVSAHWEL